MRSLIPSPGLIIGVLAILIVASPPAQSQTLELLGPRKITVASNAVVCIPIPFVVHDTARVWSATGALITPFDVVMNGVIYPSPISPDIWYKPETPRSAWIIFDATKAPTDTTVASINFGSDS